MLNAICAHLATGVVVVHPYEILTPQVLVICTSFVQASYMNTIYRNFKVKLLVWVIVSRLFIDNGNHVQL